VKTIVEALGMARLNLLAQRNSASHRRRGRRPQPEAELLVEIKRVIADQLYVAWQALANFADMCGKFVVSAKGETPQDLDKNKLENGVYEPLRDANLID
jgi:hypothetical protein